MEIIFILLETILIGLIMSTIILICFSSDVYQLKKSRKHKIFYRKISEPLQKDRYEIIKFIGCNYKYKDINCCYLSIKSDNLQITVDDYKNADTITISGLKHYKKLTLKEYKK